MVELSFRLKFRNVREDFCHTSEVVRLVDDDYFAALIWFRDNYISVKGKVRQEFYTIF